MKRIWASLPLMLLMAGSTMADSPTFKEAVKKIEAHFEPAEAKPGQTVVLKLTIELSENWYTYPTIQPNEMIKSSVNEIILPNPSVVVFVEPIENPLPHIKEVPELGEAQVYPGGATWQAHAIVMPDATPGSKDVTLKRARFLVCVSRKGADGKPEDKCLPPKTVPVSATLKVLDGPAVPIERKYQSAFITKVVVPYLTGNTIPMTFEPKQGLATESKSDGGIGVVATANGEVAPVQSAQVVKVGFDGIVQYPPLEAVFVEGDSLNFAAIGMRHHI